MVHILSPYPVLRPMLLPTVIIREPPVSEAVSWLSLHMHAESLKLLTNLTMVPTRLETGEKEGKQQSKGAFQSVSSTVFV